MDRFPADLKRFLPIFFQPIALGLLIGLVLLAGLNPAIGLADEPGFPSPTPSITPTRTITATLGPTGVPSATTTTLPTLTPIVLAAGQDTNQQVIAPTPQPIPPEAGGGGIGCWPVGLFFLLLVILLITWYFTRRSHTEEEEYSV